MTPCGQRCSISRTSVDVGKACYDIVRDYIGATRPTPAPCGAHCGLLEDGRELTKLMERADPFVFTIPSLHIRGVVSHPQGIMRT